MFGQPKKTEFSSEEMRKLGRLEAVVESLELKWTLHRDELRKLVNRLEKREERLEKKLREAPNQIVEVGNSGGGNGADRITERVLARRNRNVHA